MPINILSKELSEKIAAGEVVDRPASVVKELIENSIDANATAIEIEITSNGLKTMRITDNGEGIAPSDIKKAFQRHATSKVCKEEDLYRINTLGFRGEALAAIAAVSKVRLISRTKDNEDAYEYIIEGGIEKSYEISGADYGTSFVISDIFYNTPARLKFLKKDVSEGNAIQTIIQQQILSHADIAFKFIREGKIIYTSPGNGSLFTSAFSILPREISTNLIDVSNSDSHYGISVAGLIGRPEISRKSRAFQYTFVNKRYVKSATISAAVEQAYRSMNLAGGYPVFILNILLPFDMVDVNVHPAKTEVRFANEQEVFLSTHKSVTLALSSMSSVITSIPLKAKEDSKNIKVNTDLSSSNDGLVTNLTRNPDIPFSGIPESKIFALDTSEKTNNIPFENAKNLFSDVAKDNQNDNALEGSYESLTDDEKAMSDIDFRVVGELFDLYIVIEASEHFLLIDKHAAHERILYEEIKDTDLKSIKQILLVPEVITVTQEEKRVILENIAAYDELGFYVEEFGENEIAVREVPMYFISKSVGEAILEITNQISQGVANPKTLYGIWFLKSLSCRAAVKAGYRSTQEEIVRIAKLLFLNDIPKHCPHGRNIVFSVSKQEIDRHFGR